MIFEELEHDDFMVTARTLLELKHLSQWCPEGIYILPSPENQQIWNGVLFIQDGMYAGASLKFEMQFSQHANEDLPFIHFVSHVYHPLVGNDGFLNQSAMVSISNIASEVRTRLCTILNCLKEMFTTHFPLFLESTMYHPTAFNNDVVNDFNNDKEKFWLKVDECVVSSKKEMYLKDKARSINFSPYNFVSHSDSEAQLLAKSK